jgi:hypothetical protein
VHEKRFERLLGVSLRAVAEVFGMTIEARPQQLAQLPVIRLDNLTDALGGLLDEERPESYLSIVGGQALA